MKARSITNDEKASNNMAQSSRCTTIAIIYNVINENQIFSYELLDYILVEWLARKKQPI